MTPWFGYSINAYRGCSHACVYCFARPTHDYLGFNMVNGVGPARLRVLQKATRLRGTSAPSEGE